MMQGQGRGTAGLGEEGKSWEHMGGCGQALPTVGLWASTPRVANGLAGPLLAFPTLGSGLGLGRVVTGPTAPWSPEQLWPWLPPVAS